MKKITKVTGAGCRQVSFSFFVPTWWGDCWERGNDRFMEMYDERTQNRVETQSVSLWWRDLLEFVFIEVCVV